MEIRISVYRERGVSERECSYVVKIVCYINLKDDKYGV
jgi:hypothetical protein